MIAFFLCASLWSTTEIVYQAPDLIPGISPLPTDCRWLPPDPSNKVDSIVVYDTVDDVSVALVYLSNGFIGYSAGYYLGV